MSGSASCTGRKHFDLSRDLHHEHPAVGQEFDIRRQIEPGRQDLVLETVVFATFTTTGDESVPFPAASRAIAVSACEPFGPCAYPN